jgi:hypothetical protein
MSSTNASSRSILLAADGRFERVRRPCGATRRAGAGEGAGGRDARQRECHREAPSRSSGDPIHGKGLVLPDRVGFLLAYLLLDWVIPSSVLGIVVGGLMRLTLGRPWSRKAAIGDAVLASVITYIAILMEVFLTPLLMADGILYWGHWVELSFGVASVVASQLVQQLRSGKLRTAILLKVVGGVLLLVVLLVGAGIWYRTPPSDASLQRRFYEHRADLEQIVKMIEQEVHLETITKESIIRDDDYLVSPRQPRGISEQRWNQYRELFQRAGVAFTQGDPRGGIGIVARPSFQFSIEALSLSYAGGTDVRYVHCGNEPATDPTKAYLPWGERKESGELRDHVWVRYKRIEGDWYILESSYPH